MNDPIGMPENDGVTWKNEKRSVLIVDDIPANLELLSEVLEEDYQLFIATNGPDALEVVANQTIDLILLDVVMPGMDGYQVCQRLQESPATRAIPILFVTSKSDPTDETMALERGAVDFLTKPVNPAVVKARVKTHLGLKSAREVLESQNAALQHAAQLREDVDRIMRHDLKSPVNSIIGFTTLLLSEEKLDPDQTELMNYISDSAYSLLQMISLSLDMYKMEQGNYLFTPKPFNLLALLGKIIRGNESQSNFKKIVYTLLLNDTPPGPHDLFLLYGEELLCYSMFSNLLKNAVEASPPRGVITIRMTRTENPNRADIAIHNLKSVPMAIRHQFFKKYATSGKAGGTGLGAYSAKLMAETQQGSIHLQTSDEEGTTITVLLPTPPTP